MRLSYTAWQGARSAFSGLRTDTVNDPIVLLHGFGASAIGWTATAVLLSKSFDIVAPDLPAHGGQPALGSLPSLNAFADAVEGVLDELGVERCHIVGHSLGGAIALELLNRSQRFRSVVLLAPAGCGPSLNEEFFTRFLRADSVEAMSEVLNLAVHHRFKITSAMARSALVSVRQNGAGLDAIVRQIGQSALRAPVHALKTFRGPRLVVWGEEDGISPSSNAEAFNQLSTIEVLKTTGHLPHIERPTLAAELIRPVVNQAAE